MDVLVVTWLGPKLYNVTETRKVNRRYNGRPGIALLWHTHGIRSKIRQ